MIGFNFLGKLGQLGNQMFQYAAAMGVARQLDVPFSIPKHNEVIDDGLGNKLRIELFEVFKLVPDNIGYVSGIDIQEQTFEFDPKFFSLENKNVYNLIGFFQSEEYFKHSEEEVRKNFEFVDYIQDDCKDMVDVVKDSVALHIRRGDYLINSQNHYNLTLDYYQEALSHFDKDQQVIIFSDDSQWCKEQKIFLEDRFLVSETDNSRYDLYLMSKCSDFIIANSTFSWWGAWLANKGKIIAPKQWFGPALDHKNTKDLYPQGWIKI
jgi:hypothetical protein